MPRKQKEAPVEVNEVKEVKEEAKEEVKEEKKEEKRKRSPPKQKEPKEDVLAKVKQGLKELLALC